MDKEDLEERIMFLERHIQNLQDQLNEASYELEEAKRMFSDLSIG